MYHTVLCRDFKKEEVVLGKHFFFKEGTRVLQIYKSEIHKSLSIIPPNTAHPTINITELRVCGLSHSAAKHIQLRKTAGNIGRIYTEKQKSEKREIIENHMCLAIPDRPAPHPPGFRILSKE